MANSNYPSVHGHYQDETIYQNYGDTESYQTDEEIFGYLPGDNPSSENSPLQASGSDRNLTTKSSTALYASVQHQPKKTHYSKEEQPNTSNMQYTQDCEQIYDNFDANSGDNYQKPVVEDDDEVLYGNLGANASTAAPITQHVDYNRGGSVKEHKVKRIVIEREMREETKELRHLHENLSSAAVKCREKYSPYIQKNRKQCKEVVDSTQQEVLNAVKEISKAIHSLSLSFLERLEQQSQALVKLTEDYNVVEMDAKIRLERQDLNYLKSFSSMKYKPNTPITYRGILYPPEGVEKRAPPTRMSNITYEKYDHIGHGVQIPEEQFRSAVTDVSIFGRRASSASMHFDTSSDAQTATIKSSRSMSITTVPESPMNTQPTTAPDDEVTAAVIEDDDQDEFDEYGENIYDNFNAPVADQSKKPDENAVSASEAPPPLPRRLSRQSHSWVPDTYLYKGVVVYDYAARSEDELSIEAGEVIYVTWLEEDGWSLGVTQRGRGHVPFNYLDVSDASR